MSEVRNDTGGGGGIERLPAVGEEGGEVAGAPEGGGVEVEVEGLARARVRVRVDGVGVVVGGGIEEVEAEDDVGGGGIVETVGDGGDGGSGVGGEGGEASAAAGALSLP